MARVRQYIDGKREGTKLVIAWLHARADRMNDPRAKNILNSAAFNLGIDARRDFDRMVENARVAKVRSRSESR